MPSLRNRKLSNPEKPTGVALYATISGVSPLISQISETLHVHGMKSSSTFLAKYHPYRHVPNMENPMVPIIKHIVTGVSQRQSLAQLFEVPHILYYKKQ